MADYPSVKGMVHDVFFWDHDHPEGGKDENSSKQNNVEAVRAARLALYLTQQGYKAGDITILTPYVGEFFGLCIYMYAIAPAHRASPERVLMLHAGQLMQLRAEVSKFMRFVVSDKDAEQLAALQVGTFCTKAQIVHAASTRVSCQAKTHIPLVTLPGSEHGYMPYAAASEQHNHANCGSQPGMQAGFMHVCKISMFALTGR